MMFLPLFRFRSRKVWEARMEQLRGLGALLEVQITRFSRQS
jgi:hypothetical protein